MADNETTNDVIGKRLSVVGVLGALGIGVIWLAQWNTHRESEGLGVFGPSEPFNNTPYAIAFGVAVALIVFGTVLRGSGR